MDDKRSNFMDQSILFQIIAPVIYNLWALTHWPVEDFNDILDK